MAFADGCTNCLTWLLPSSILNDHILVRASPSLLLVASGLEDALIGKDEVATIFEDLVNLVSKLDGHVGVLLVELVLLLRLVLGLHLLELEAINPKTPKPQIYEKYYILDSQTVFLIIFSLPEPKDPIITYNILVSAEFISSVSHLGVCDFLLGFWGYSSS